MDNYTPRVTSLLLSLMAMSLLLLVGCVDKPIAPTWDVQVNAPIINKSYSLMDVAEKDPTHIVDTTQSKMGLLYYNQTNSLTPVQVGDKLKLTPIQTSTSVSLGKITLNTLTYSTQLSSKDIIGVTGGSNVNVVVPSFSHTVSSGITVTDFTSATFNSGTLNLILTNNLGNFTVNVSQVRLLDGSGNEILRSATSLSLTNGQSGTVALSLAGKTLVSNMKIEVSLSSPGTTSAVNIPATSNLNIQMQMTNLDPSTVTGPIKQAYTLNASGSFALDNDPNSYFTQIVIASGTMTFSITNNFKMTVNTRFVLPNLLNASGKAFDTTLALKPGATTVSWAINGWSITSGSSSTPITALAYTATGTVPVTSSSVTISKTDNIGVNVSMTQLVLSYLKGKIKTTQLDLKSTVLQVKLGNLKNFTATSLHFSNFGFYFNIGSSPTLKLGFGGTVIGNNNTKKDSITIPTTVLQGAGLTQTVTLDATQLDHFINSFSSAPPDYLTINYKATVNPNPSSSDPIGQIASTDTIFGNANIHAALNLGISGGKVVDTVNVSIADNNKSDLNKIKSILVNFNITNNIPAAVKFSGEMYDANFRPVMPFPPADSLNINPKIITIPAASVGSDGFSSTPATTTIQLLLSGTQVTNMINSKKMILTLTIDTSLPNASPVKFRTSDGITINAAGQLNYNFQP